MNHPVKECIKLHKQGKHTGIYSICSANHYVIEAAMERTLKTNKHVLIEATSNQVNQYGGYTGMKPADFRDFVFSIAEKTGFPRQKIILGGDHLGPQVWKHENHSTAMEKAQILIREYVSAGFSKIHIDTSMPLGGDDTCSLTDTELVAKRGAFLCRAAQEAYQKLCKNDPFALPPVYVIGTEVPVPGGTHENDKKLKVTDPKDFENTVNAYHSAFMQEGLKDAWDNVVAVVVQPGVEFGDDFVFDYDREAAANLCSSLKKYSGLVFEGHSTDYQTPQNLRKMVEDGIAILKVGPALTFFLREALFSLYHMEKELFKYNAQILQSNLLDALDNAMLKNTEHWKKYYVGDASKIRFSLKYSLSDRCRYYLPTPEITQAIELMISNLRTAKIPLSLIAQYMPKQYNKIRSGLLENDPEAMLKDKIDNLLDDYEYAIAP